MRSVLLGDVLDEILGEGRLGSEKYPFQDTDCSFSLPFPGAQNDTSSRVSAVVKIDIEQYECRALTGSPSALAHPRLFIGYIVMEWIFP